MIELVKEDGLWIATINRPEKANSLTEAMLTDLVDIADEAKDARALILTGAGSVFSAGADLEEARRGLATSPLWERLSAAIASLDCLTVAALNGTLAGGANGMALACDIRLAAPEAKFFYPVMKLGFLPQPSDPERMAALIGPARTKLLLMGGQKIPAQTAYDYGLIEKIVDQDDLMQVARELVSDTIHAPIDVARGIADLCR